MMQIVIYMQVDFKLGIALLFIGLIGRRVVLRTKQRDFHFKVGTPSQVIVQPYKGGFHGQMSRQEALLILGIEDQPSAEVIKEKHRKLMMANHPDNNGSTFLATKINEAKDILMTGGP